MIYTLLYISIVQLAAKDWELLPEELNVWQKIIKIGEAIANELREQVRLDLNTFQIETEQANLMRKMINSKPKKITNFDIQSNLGEIMEAYWKIVDHNGQ
jgi:hypothetical protein